MLGDLQLGYLGVEVPDVAGLSGFFADVVGLAPGDDPGTWRNDSKARRVIVAEGPSADATFVGFEAAGPDAWAATVARLEDAGYSVGHATTEETDARRVDQLVHVDAPWGVRVEVTHGLAEAEQPFASPLVAGGFVTEDEGFGHVVFATTAFDESHRFVTEGLGLRQTDWVETEIAAGIELEIRFYHCNPRHHSLALARAPFDLPQRLHHFMVEVSDRETTAALEGQRRLVREVHHRVKNNLQVVASLLNIHGRSAETSDARAAYAGISRRVGALSIVHRNNFAEMEENRGISLRPLVTELAAELRAGAPEEARGVRIDLDIDTLYTTQDAAVAVAFLITEIIEFAMLNAPQEPIELSLRRTSELTARLTIGSSILRPDDEAEPGKPQFERIVGGLAKQLRSPLDRKLGRYSVDLPVFPVD